MLVLHFNFVSKHTLFLVMAVISSQIQTNSFASFLVGMMKHGILVIYYKTKKNESIKTIIVFYPK